MTSAFLAPGARPGSAAAPREAVFSFAALPVNSSSTLRWNQNELAVSVTQGHAAHRETANTPCSLAVGSVPRMVRRARAHSPFLPGCVLRRPAVTTTKRNPCISDEHRIVCVPADRSPVSTASRQVHVPPAPQQLRRPSLQLPASLPNGIPLRRTASSCFEHYKILEPVGAGTYANVWKVQRLPIPRFYNQVPLTPAELSSLNGTGVTHVSDAPYHNNCTEVSSVEEERGCAVANVIPRKTPGIHASPAVYVQKAYQRQPPACSSSNSSVDGRMSSSTSSMHRGHVRSRGPAEGQIYAAKLLQLDRFSSDTLPRVLDMFSKEIVNLAACQCPGVVGLHEVVEGKEGWLLVQDFVDGGTIWCEDICRDEDEAFLHFIQVLQAVLYLQENNILHRDLKPTNILRSKQSRRIVIADFGWSERLDCCHITPMEWPGTLEINPPEIINGTGPLTDRLDNYAVGMTLLLFLSGRFVCRQKGLDAATAAPYVLRTVHELRQGPPPAVFKGSGEAWSLFIGLTAPHPFRRWSLDNVLAHTWVQQKLLRLFKQAFIWHPRVLQLATGLQRAYGHSLCTGEPGNLRSSTQAARGGYTAAPASTCRFESLVKVLSGSDAATRAVLWTPLRYLAGTVNSASATAQTLRSGRKLSTTSPATWEAAFTDAANAQGAPCGKSSCAGGAYCEQCCTVRGPFLRKWHVVRSEGEPQLTDAAQRSHNVSPSMNNCVTHLKATPTFPSSCTSQHTSLKGLCVERGNSCSRRQSLSICSTTDSFMTSLSFQQQQQASQQSARGHLCVQTVSPTFTPKSHVERAAAEAADWKVLLSRRDPKKSASVDGAALQDSGEAIVLQQVQTCANNEAVLSVRGLRRYQQGLHLRGIRAFDRYLLCKASESTDKLQEGKSVETHAQPTLVTGSSCCVRCPHTLTPVPQSHEEQQIVQRTCLQQQRPLPWWMLLPDLATEGEARLNGDSQGAEAGVRATEHSKKIFPLGHARALCHAKPLCSPPVGSTQEHHNVLAAADPHRGEHIVDNEFAAFSDWKRTCAVHLNSLDKSDDPGMPPPAFGKPRLLRSHPYARHQESFAHSYRGNGASQRSILTFTGRVVPAPLEASVEDDGVYNVESSWTAHQECEPPRHTGDPIADEGIVERREFSTSKKALQHGRAATVPLSHFGGTASAKDQGSRRQCSQRVWHSGAAPFSNPYLTSNTCNTLDYSKHTVFTSAASACYTAACNGEASAFAPQCAAGDAEATVRWSTKLPLQRKQYHLLPMSAALPVARKANQTLPKSSNVALSFPVTASQHYPVSSVAATNRSASSISHHRRMRGSLTPAHGHSGTLLTGEGPKGKRMHIGLPRKLPHAALSLSLDDSAVPTTDTKEPVDQLFTTLRRERRGVHAAGSEPEVPVLSRTHAMQRLPSQLSAFPFENHGESAADFTHRRPNEVAAAGASASEIFPALHLRIPSAQLHVLQTVRCVTEKARELRKDSLNSPPAAFPGAASTVDETANGEPACVAAALRRTDNQAYTDGTQQEWRSPRRPGALLRVDAASLASVCLDSLAQVESGSRSGKPLRSREWEKTAAQTRQKILNPAPSAMLPATLGVFPGSLHFSVEQEMETAHINPSVSSAVHKSGDGMQAGASLTEQTGHQQQRNSPESLNDGRGFESTVQRTVPDLQRQIRTMVSSVYEKKRDQIVGASVRVNESTAAFRGYSTLKREKDNFSWNGQDMARYCGDRTKLCKQYFREAACPHRGGTGVEDTQAELQKGQAGSSELEKTVEPSAPQQLTTPAVESVDIFGCAQDGSKSAAAPDIPLVAGYVTHFTGSSVGHIRQPVQSRKAGYSAASPEEMDGAYTLSSRGNHADSHNTIKITGRIEFYREWHSAPSVPFPFASSSCKSGDRLVGRRKQHWRSDTRIYEHDGRAEGHMHGSSTSEKSFRPAGSSRQSSELRAVGDVVTGRVAVSPFESRGVRRSNGPLSTRTVQETSESLCSRCSSAEGSLGSECLVESYANREAAEANGTRRATAARSYLAAAVKTACVNPLETRTGNSVTHRPGIEAEGRLCETTESLMSSTIHNACRQGPVSSAAAMVYSSSAQLRCREHPDQQLHEGGLFYPAAAMQSVIKYKKPLQDKKDQALPWQRAASFPATVTTTRKRMYNIAQSETIFLCGQKYPRGKPPVSSCALLGKMSHNNSSAAVPIFELSSEPVATPLRRYG